jgi:hypothetical protein
MWPHRKADKLLEEMIRENKLAEEAADGGPPQHRSGPSGRRHETERLAAERAAKRRDRRSDLTIAALGVTLGLICALFPWYIFFNPEEFGVRAMKFGGSGGGTEPIMLGAQPDRVGAPVAVQELPPMELDLRTTGTAEKEPEDGGGGDPSLDLTDQPFPPPVVSFKVVQIANGRAMLEDSTGLFIVEAGSVLPDSTRVKSIEQRDGRPVLVTESGVELEISE